MLKRQDRDLALVSSRERGDEDWWGCVVMRDMVLSGVEYNPWLFFPSWSMPPDDCAAIKPF
jgi:hypothetical protein